MTRFTTMILAFCFVAITASNASAWHRGQFRERIQERRNCGQPTPVANVVQAAWNAPRVVGQAITQPQCTCQGCPATDRPVDGVTK